MSGAERPSAPTGGRRSDRTAEAGELVASAKVLGSSLDVLVRAARAGGQGLASVARRTTELWREQAGRSVTIGPTSLSVDGRIGLVTTEIEGRWLLPTFMSGLRELRASPRLTLDELMRLAEELGALESTGESISRFEDWLWSDGAEGFEVDLQPSFVEVFEVADTAETQRPWQAVAAVRAQGAMALSPEAMQVTSSDLDAAAVRPEFQIALELYEERLHSKRPVPSAERLDRLSAACDSGAAWIGAELSSILADPQLRQAVPAPRLARRIISLVSIAADATLFDLLRDIQASAEDRYKTELFASLEEQRLGEAIGSGARLDDPRTAVALEDFMRSAPPSLSVQIARRLLQRCQDEPAALDVVVQLLDHGEWGSIMRLLDLSVLGPAEGVAFYEALRRGHKPERSIRWLLQNLPVTSASTVIATLPPEELERYQPQLERLLENEDSRSLDTLLTRLLDHGDRQGLALVATALARQLGEGWRPMTVRRSAKALVEAGQGEAIVVPLARASKAPTFVRLIALEALASRSDLLAAAAAWRPSEMLEQPEMRRALRAARRQSGRKP